MNIMKSTATTFEHHANRDGFLHQSISPLITQATEALNAGAVEITIRTPGILTNAAQNALFELARRNRDRLVLRFRDVDMARVLPPLLELAYNEDKKEGEPLTQHDIEWANSVVDSLIDQ